MSITTSDPKEEMGDEREWEDSVVVCGEGGGSGGGTIVLMPLTLQLPWGNSTACLKFVDEGYVLLVMVTICEWEHETISRIYQSLNR